MRRIFYSTSLLAFLAVGFVYLYWPPILWLLVLLVPLCLLGVMDCTQGKHAVKRNFPVVGHFRYILEGIRPEINQYFIESNTDGMPFNREFRSVVYQRSKQSLATLPFGTQHDVYEPGYEWLNHSMKPKSALHPTPRIRIGGPDCEKPYESSILNISAMSFGSLSKNAILALNTGARLGGFAHNTGEGSISPYHAEPGGDLIWQIGTGYFGCRDRDGNFDARGFQERAISPQVKMIEIKLSQGAKPGHGGILPGAKVTEEIAKIRLVPIGQDVISPPSHKEFSTPAELLLFVQKLRVLSDGKPVGIKLCLGARTEFMSLCKGMIEANIHPDFIVVDGGEGGTGAAPLEFSNSLGTPGLDALAFVHGALTGCGLRDKIKVGYSGKIATGFHMARALALGADFCNAARAFMFSLGCIQALRCNSNHCPVGVATQSPGLTGGLVVKDKAIRVQHWHESTVEAMLELIGAAGLEHPDHLRPWHIYRRVTRTEVQHYGQIYPQVDPGIFLEGTPPSGYHFTWVHASSEKFGHFQDHSTPAPITEGTHAWPDSE
jgi:glutamate synthase domain-containing protein 2